MGACSTKTITRPQAISLLLEACAQATDKEVEEVLNYACGGERPLIQLDGHHLVHFQISDSTE